MNTIQALQQIKIQVDNLAINELGKESATEFMIACHHLSQAIKFESYRIKRQESAIKPPIVDSATLSKSAITDSIIHQNGLVEFVLANGQNVFLRGEHAEKLLQELNV